MFNAEDWSKTELHLQGLPGSTTLCERVRDGFAPWPEIGVAMSYCTRFPTTEFNALLGSNDFDVRWPLTFAAWYLSACGQSVDQDCADFVTAAGLWDKAMEVLPDYTGHNWLIDWRHGFEQRRRMVAAAK